LDYFIELFLLSKFRGSLQPLGGADALIYWNILSEQDIINIQKSKETYRRKTVATLMTSEIINWGISSELARPLIPQALQELWHYVDNP
jgi:hypothetical protein